MHPRRSCRIGLLCLFVIVGNGAVRYFASGFVYSPQTSRQLLSDVRTDHLGQLWVTNRPSGPALVTVLGANAANLSGSLVLVRQTSYWPSDAHPPLLRKTTVSTQLLPNKLSLSSETRQLARECVVNDPLWDIKTMRAMFPPDSTTWQLLSGECLRFLLSLLARSSAVVFACIASLCIVSWCGGHRVLEIVANRLGYCWVCTYPVSLEIWRCPECGRVSSLRG